MRSGPVHHAERAERLDAGAIDGAHLDPVPARRELDRLDHRLLPPGAAPSIGFPVWPKTGTSFMYTL